MFWKCSTVFGAMALAAIVQGCTEADTPSVEHEVNRPIVPADPAVPDAVIIDRRTPATTPPAARQSTPSGTDPSGGTTPQAESVPADERPEIPADASAATPAQPGAGTGNQSPSASPDATSSDPPTGDADGELTDDVVEQPADQLPQDAQDGDAEDSAAENTDDSTS
jgi:hypothetical protein